MTYSRPTILVLNGHYLPAFKAGGPVRSIANLIEAMGDEFDFRVICADRDLGDGEPYREIARDRWISVGRTPVHYTFPGLQSLSGLAHIVRETPHDILYLNSFFSPRFTIRPLVARRLGLIPSRPLVIAPRGEFSSGALALKAAKKQAWIGIGGRLGLFSDVTWQASSEHEADDIRAALPKHARSIHVARNLPAPLATKPPTHAPRAPSEPLRITRTHLLRKLAASERAAHVGWSAKRGASIFWISRNFLTEYEAYQIDKLACIEAAWQAAAA